MALAPPIIKSCSPTGYNSVALEWTNEDEYDSLRILRDGSPITDWLSGSTVSYTDTICVDGTSYSYVIRAKREYEEPDPPEFADSSPASATTPLIPPTGLGGSGAPTSVALWWNDNTGNESGYKIYCNGSYLTSVGANVTTYQYSGLNPATWYSYYVTAYNGVTESAPSNEISIFTADPPAAPSNPSATAISTSQINLSWSDNSDNETGFKIEESENGVDGWSQIGTVGAGGTTYQRTGLTTDTLRYYRICAYNDSGNSGYTAVVSARTFAAIAQPTNLMATPYSDTQIELTFQDNSEEEDDHRLERKTGGGAFAEVAIIPANADFYRDTGLTKGLTYVYRVRAKQGAQYSDYSSEASATTLSEPADPTGLAITEITDTTLRLTWTPTTGETGYKIEKSVNGADYSEIAKITDSISSFLIKGLSAGTQYWFRIRAYNIVGNSGYAGPVTDTTAVQYEPTDFEEFIRRPVSTFIFLVEINPKLTLSGWSKTGGLSYVYEVAVEERGIDVEEAFENGAALTKKTSIADVEATAGTFYFDFYGRKIYVRTTSGDSPANYFMEGAFWLYVTNYSAPETPTVFNDKNYLPILEKADIPDVSQAITPLYEGNFAISSGSISLKNPRLPDGYYWDKRYARYTLRNRKVVIKAGGVNFAYADFETIFTALITGEHISDARLSLNLEDFRGGIHRDIPINHFWKTEYPNLGDDNDKGKEIPVAFGALAGVAPVCCDAVNRKYKLNDGRIKSISKAYKNDEELAAGTDYYVDYQRGVLILSRSLALESADTITVDYEGTPNSANELITNGADKFIHICREFLSLSVSELDLDSIYETKYESTAALAAYIQTTSSSEEIIRNIEHSCLAYTYQDRLGRLGLKSLGAVPASNAVYVRNHHVFGFARERSLADIYDSVRVYYNQNPRKDDEWESVVANNARAGQQYRLPSKPLEIYTYLTAKADAEALAAALRDELNKDIVSFSVPAVMFGVQVGDLFYLSRDRFPSASGTANNVVMRILSIQKQIGAGKTAIQAEVVS